MPNPKKRHTRSRTGKRRGSNWRLTAAEPAYDKQTDEFRLPHRIGPKSGMYKGELVLPKKQKKKKGENPEG